MDDMTINGEKASDRPGPNKRTWDEAEDKRKFPDPPRTTRGQHQSTRAGGWEAIDNLSVEQCARIPAEMQTIEFIPNSIQEEWTEAWNLVHQRRRSAITWEEVRQGIEVDPVDLSWITSCTF